VEALRKGWQEVIMGERVADPVAAVSRDKVGYCGIRWDAVNRGIGGILRIIMVARRKGHFRALRLEAAHDGGARMWLQRNKVAVKCDL